MGKITNQFINNRRKRIKVAHNTRESSTEKEEPKWVSDKPADSRFKTLEEKVDKMLDILRDMKNDLQGEIKGVEKPGEKLEKTSKLSNMVIKGVVEEDGENMSKLE